MKLPSAALRLVAGTILGALLLAPAGCSTRIVLPVAPKPDEPPAAATPADALRRLAWSWKHRALEPCRDLFSCDYEFVFSPEDTSGRRFVGRPWTRPDEIDFARHLFETGSAQARPASYVALDMEDDPPALPDDRPGKGSRWHRRIETPFVAVVEAPGRQFRVFGIERFYFVRGDSACIPQELRDRGYVPDSTRWWIERWEDNSVSARLTTLGAIKALYLDAAPPAP